jgi:Pectate lyase superfamily protein/Viral BACON domain
MVLSSEMKLCLTQANAEGAADSNLGATTVNARRLNRLFFSSLIFLHLISAGSLSSALSDSPLTVAVTSPIRLSTSQGGRAVRSPLVLTNAGTANVDWTSSSNQAWLKLEPSSGSLPPKASASIELIADPTDFAPGIYVASAKIAVANEKPRILDVTMTEQSAFAGDTVATAQRTFPPDSGMVNVKTAYGAKGDGVTDDTQAIQQAISSVVHHPQLGPRILYFPAGTYMVSRPLLEKDLMSRWNSLLTLQGENRATTTIKLTDSNPLYQNASSPTAVLQFASQNGGKYGGGNSAFDNNIYDITIDTGRGNPGAVALDFIGNNYCALRNVTIQSSDPNHSGAIGLALLRYAAGPCFIKNVVINGFDYGIKVSNNEYSLTLEDLSLLNQRLYGIYNASNVLSIRHLFSTNSVPAIHNQNAAGLITLIGAVLQGGSSQLSAIENQGTLYARDVSSTGYAGALEGQPGANITEYDSGPTFTQFGSKTSSLNLPIEETPQFEDENLNDWKSVTDYGADPSGVKDSSTAIQAAIDSGATTVYFPTGVYVVTRTILVRGKVRMLEGFDSSVNPAGEAFNRAGSPAPLFKITAGTADITFDHFRMGAFYAHPAGSVIFIQQDSARPVVLRDSIIGGTPTTIAYQNMDRGTGTLFVENVAGQPWRIMFPQNMFARQINPEGNTSKITNKGGNLWFLGLKTEGTGPNIETDEGGSTEVLGGLIYPVWKTAPTAANFIVTDSHASFIYAVSNYKPPAANTNFAIQVQESRWGVLKSLLTTSLPSRGLGTMVPLYSSGDMLPDSKKTHAGSAASH